MRLRILRITTLLRGSAIIGGASLCAAASPAQASGVLLLAPLIMQSAAITLNVDSRCVVFTYDKNGNRITQTTSTPPATTTWGSARYGCFAWHQ